MKITFLDMLKARTAVFALTLLALQRKNWCFWIAASQLRDGTIRLACVRASRASFNAHSADNKELRIY
jgi:hypothetical protein